MAIPTAITDLSATIASNSPAGGDQAFPNIDDYLRAAYAFIRQGDTKASDVASAATVDLGAVVGRIVDCTGTATVTSFGTTSAGIWRIVRFTGALTLTHNATSLILPGGANITTAAGDCLVAVSLGSGNWVVTHYQKAAGYLATGDVPTLASGTWTPSVSNSTNVASTGSTYGRYLRVGSIVHVSGFIQLTPTSDALSMLFMISMPVASAFTAGTEAHGTANIMVNDSTYGAGIVYADPTYDLLAINIPSCGSGTQNVYFTGSYTVV